MKIGFTIQVGWDLSGCFQGCHGERQRTEVNGGRSPIAEGHPVG